MTTNQPDSLPETSTLREQLVKLAYMILPLPSGCSNCWGDLGEGCTDECRRSSDEHGRKVDDIIETMTDLIDQEKVKELKALNDLPDIPHENIHVKAIYKSAITDRINHLEKESKQ